jgi:hypothetical protein
LGRHCSQLAAGTLLVMLWMRPPAAPQHGCWVLRSLGKFGAVFEIASAPGLSSRVHARCRLRRSEPRCGPAPLPTLCAVMQKRMRLAQLPPVLCLHLKRFKYVESMGRWALRPR